MLLIVTSVLTILITITLTLILLASFMKSARPRSEVGGVCGDFDHEGKV